MRKKFLGLLMLAIATFGLIACGNTENNQETEHDHEHEEKTFLNLRIGLEAHDGEAHYEAAERFAAEIEAKTDGAIKATVYGSGELGTNEKLLKYLSEDANRVDVVIADLADLAMYEPMVDISEMPFMFADYEEANKFLNGQIQEDAARGLERHNMQALAYYSHGFRNLLTKQVAAREAKELQGVKIVTIEETKADLAMKALGARLEVMNYSDVQQAVQQGYCMGYEGTLEEMVENRVYQGQEYVILTNHTHTAAGLVISDKLWDGLEAKYKNIIKEAAKASAHQCIEGMSRNDSQYISELEERGLRLQAPMLDGYWDKAQSVLKGHSSKYGNLVDKVIASKY